MPRRTHRRTQKPEPTPAAPPEPEVAPEAVPDPVEPAAPVPEVVVVAPTVADLRAEYDRLAKLVPTLKRDGAEWKDAMQAKLLAFTAWHAAAKP